MQEIQPHLILPSVKNILLYTDTPQVGGAETQMFLLAKFLNKEKFNPILACSSYPQLNKWCENFEKEGIKVIRINVKHKHDPRNFFHLKKILKDEKIDILHIHIWNPASGRYAFLAANSCKIPIITTEHDPFKLSFLKNLFKKSTLKKVQTIITVSKNNQQILKKLYPEHKEKIKVIHNGIDTVWWQSQLIRFTDEDRKKIKKQVFLADGNTLIIMSIAELHERKGLKYLIEAVSKIGVFARAKTNLLTTHFADAPRVISKNFTKLNSAPQNLASQQSSPTARTDTIIKLVIVGEGPQRKNLEKLIKKLDITDHVILLGRQKEIPKLLKSSDIFVLPSLREAFGLVILEAMITGVPVIASKAGGIPEIINNKNGLLVKSENSEELAIALIKLLADTKKRQKLASAGQKTVLKKFTAKKMAEEYEREYDSIAVDQPSSTQN